MGNAEVADFIKRSSQVDDEWVADMNKRGFNGAKLLQAAKDLIAKYGKA
jgi:TRAP-type transport system periplasmic protein